MWLSQRMEMSSLIHRVTWPHLLPRHLLYHTRFKAPPFSTLATDPDADPTLCQCGCMAEKCHKPQYLYHMVKLIQMSMLVLQLLDQNIMRIKTHRVGISRDASTGATTNSAVMMCIMEWLESIVCINWRSGLKINIYYLFFSLYLLCKSVTNV